MYPIVFYRVILVWLAVGGALGLGGCSTFEAVFHPHRLGTPAMSPEAKAKLRAAEKARHKGLTLPTTEADATSTEATAPSPDATAPSAAATKSKSYSELPAGTRTTYDKQGLLKKSTLVRLQQNRRQLHQYDLSAPKHTDATRDERHLRKHSKSPGKPAAEPKAPAEPTEPAPTPDPTQPAPTQPTPPTKAPATRPAAKVLPPRSAKVAPKARASQAAPAATPPDAPDAPAPPAAEPATSEPATSEPAATSEPEKKSKKAPKAPKPDPTQPPGSN